MLSPIDERLDPSEEDVRVLKPRRAAPNDSVRPTRAEVNLAHLRHNFRVLERTIKASGATRPSAVWGVLKADAYGHGAPAVARTLERAGMPTVCVALLEEALELRAAGIRTPILVMGGYFGGRRAGLDEIIEFGLTPVIHDVEQLQLLAQFARSKGERMSIHLKVDTGMSRLGVPMRELNTVLEQLSAHQHELVMEGLMTHFACADSDDVEATREQLRHFDEARARVHALGFSPRIEHASNSAALFRVPEAHLDATRPGIALFGVEPRDGLTHDLRPVMRVRSEVVALRKLEQGESVGYGHTWSAARPSSIATVPMGYADGLDRSLGNRGDVLIRGKRARIVGAVSMDLTTIDVTDVEGARMGDEVVFLGQQDGPLGKDTITATEIATLTGTIPWQVLTNISRRVPRFYREP